MAAPQPDNASIQKAARLIGVQPVELKRAIDALHDVTKHPSRRGWVAKARRVILSVSPEFNAERLAEKLYSVLVVGGGSK